MRKFSHRIYYYNTNECGKKTNHDSKKKKKCSDCVCVIIDKIYSNVKQWKLSISSQDLMVLNWNYLFHSFIPNAYFLLLFSSVFHIEKNRRANPCCIYYLTGLGACLCAGNQSIWLYMISMFTLQHSDSQSLLILLLNIRKNSCSAYQHKLSSLPWGTFFRH